MKKRRVVVELREGSAVVRLELRDVAPDTWDCLMRDLRSAIAEVEHANECFRKAIG